MPRLDCNISDEEDEEICIGTPREEQVTEFPIIEEVRHVDHQDIEWDKLPCCMVEEDQCLTCVHPELPEEVTAMNEEVVHHQENQEDKWLHLEAKFLEEWLTLDENVLPIELE